MKYDFLIALLCLTPLKMMAQNSSKKATITLATLYSSNVSYYGQSTDEKLPYVLFNVSARLPSGFHFSAGSYKLLNYGPGLSETDIGAGFDYDFSDKFSAGTSYTRSFFPSNSPLLQASNANNINLSGTYSALLFKSEFSADYAFGKQSDLFLSLTNSKEIGLGNLFTDKNTLYIEPAIEFVAGTRHFYNAYTGTKAKRNKGKGKSQTSPGNSGNASATTDTIRYDSFNLLSYNLKLPLGFSRANYLVELNYQFSILGPKAEADLKKRLSLFGVSFYYQF